MESQVFSSDTLAAGTQELRWQGVKIEGSPEKDAMEREMQDHRAQRLTIHMSYIT